MLFSEDLKKEFINEYEELYFKSKESNSKIARSIKGIDKKVEEHICNRLEKFKSENRSEKIDRQIIAWKAGRLNDEKEKGDGINGYGRKIEMIDEYLKDINEDRDKIYESIKKDDFYETYNILLKPQKKNKVKNFGPVYIITVIFFFSGGKYPIYDKFAHKAAKALFMDANPSDIYLGINPDKNDIRSVMYMYNEYCWLLQKLFGNYDIPRELDRALWVYGHSINKWGSIKWGSEEAKYKMIGDFMEKEKKED